ncbi:MAG TPA: PRC-barrel domain-containing protein [Polyangia bacterium]
MARISELVGTKVISQDGRVVGEIAGFEVDTDAWRVVGLVLRVERDLLERLHLKKPLLGSQQITIPIRHVAGVSDTVVLGLPLAGLGEMTARDAAPTRPAGEPTPSET